MPLSEKESPEAKLRKFNESFIDDVEEDPKGHGVVEDSDEDSDEDSISFDGDESSEEETQDEEVSKEKARKTSDSKDTEEEESDEDDKSDEEDEDIDDLLLTSEERQARVKGTKGEDSSIEFSDEDTKFLKTLEQFKDDEKFGAVASQMSDRYRRMLESEDSTVRVLQELSGDLKVLGLTPQDLRDPQWTQRVINGVRRATIQELKDGGFIAETPRKAETKSEVSQDVTEIADDEVITGAELKALLKQELSKVSKPVNDMLSERENATLKNRVESAFEHHWKSNPFLRRMGEDPKEGTEVKKRAFKALGEDYRLLLGRDGAGMPIRESLDAFADFLRLGHRSLRNTLSSESNGDGKKASASKSGTPIGRKGKHEATRKVSKIPPAYEKVGNQVVKRSTEDRLNQFNEEFFG